MMRIVLGEKLGVDAGNSHYALAGSVVPTGPTTTSTASVGTTLAPTTRISNGDDVEMETTTTEGGDEGLYL